MLSERDFEETSSSPTIPKERGKPPLNIHSGSEKKLRLQYRNSTQVEEGRKTDKRIRKISRHEQCCETDWNDSTGISLMPPVWENWSLVRRNTPMATSSKLTVKVYQSSTAKINSIVNEQVCSCMKWEMVYKISRFFYDSSLFFINSSQLLLKSPNIKIISPKGYHLRNVVKGGRQLLIPMWVQKVNGRLEWKPLIESKKLICSWTPK